MFNVNCNQGNINIYLFLAKTRICSLRANQFLASKYICTMATKIRAVTSGTDERCKIKHCIKQLSIFFFFRSNKHAGIEYNVNLTALVCFSKNNN